MSKNEELRMQQLTPKDGETPDLVQENIAGLKQLFPEVFIDGRIDFDALKQTLGSYVDDREERYSFTWHGKSRGRRIAQTPSTGTLLPCKEESVNWDSTQNIFIEGDNLEVLKLLQKSYHRKVKMIYIDPPYNTGKEFIYPDKWQDNLDTYLRYTGQIDDEGFKTTTNTETSGRYHTNWLNMMYPRLKLARNLLRDDGVIFVSIDDHEQANLRKLCDEIFGEENFLASICWERADSPRMDAEFFSVRHDYILCYAKSIEEARVTRLPYSDENTPTHFNKVDEDGRRYYLKPLRAMGGQGETRAARPNLFYGIASPDGTPVFPKLQGGGDGAWRWSRTRVEQNAARIDWTNSNGEWTPYYRIYADESDGKPPETVWFAKDVGSTRNATGEVKEIFDGVKVFDTPKPEGLIAAMLGLVTSSADLVLDFFAGSGTTGHAVWMKNVREASEVRWVLVQLPERLDTTERTQSLVAEYCNARGLLPSLAAISKERLRRVARTMAESGAASSAPWLGFKSFKLSSSNIKPWDSDFQQIDADLFEAVENIKPERSEHDVLYELILKYGLDLAVSVEERIIADRTVFVIGAGALVVCLASSLDLDVVRGIAALLAELAPETCRVVFKDSGFASDVVKTNAVQILKQAGVDDVKSL